MTKATVGIIGGRWGVLPTGKIFNVTCFFGQNPSYSSKFFEVARIFLDYRAILVREIYKILVSSIDILHIHVTYFFVTPEARVILTFWLPPKESE